ncbi:trans-aconitate 2-methyltransferase [Nonomuraea rhizosphaerae]|uniref:trans-aconitate 2-methyltransferase n=1 Tax=Nonomuraea rhizosphaerae TaxID=2665663 RepID=UPI001FECD99A|nr:trans-aconitate 2-methyltransferase [Nonomuraea rhizosphaerae]
MSRDIWDPTTYARYADERSRPFHDLVARIGADKPDYVVDAGCGSGELTLELSRRWPEATVEGFDSSPAMITKARQLGEGSFAVADVTMWRPDRPVDVLVSNAVLQWVPTHRDVLEHWVDALSPGGWLAFQVPGNFDAPSHVAIRELCASPAWQERLGDFDRGSPVEDPAGYVDLLDGCRVDAWETTYIHVLPGENAVLNWISGTALRPIFDRLDDGERKRFTNELAGKLDEVYPAKPYGTPFPFRRIFVVAQK